MQIRVTINAVLFPELTAYLENVNKGKRSRAVVSLANKACLSADNSVSKKNAVKRKTAHAYSSETDIKPAPVNTGSDKIILTETLPEAENTEEKGKTLQAIGQSAGFPLKRNRMI